MQTVQTATTTEGVRARHMKNFLRCVEAQEPSKRDVILGGIPTEDMALIRESSTLAWLPMTINARATEVAWNALGRGGREMFFLRLGVADFDSTLLNTLLSSAVRLFGVDPGRILRWTPRAWTQIYRDATRIEVEVTSDASLRMRFEGLPRCLARAEGWMDSVPATMVALFNVTGRRGAASVEERDVAARSMVLGFRWENVG